ncbi:Crp/Fnr family transcriptional regulator [Akkermansia glycaniphila]|uniref:Crp/Fnr family transcriptional regulator n=1 Tax=Akkermansia glycaniphila TaxID=1679444 RepID=UPI001C0299C3|nr:Crp/Fnr family transcriptional regulator [Akkermansia glycaniphila]MBT9450773.1 Crp/Fnr family transcriptional regulator [Akkermansia glycaniphila]
MEMKSDADRLAAFMQFPLFAGLSRQDLAEFLEDGVVQVVKYGRGDVLFHAGDEPRFLFVLLSGAVHICRDSKDGRRMIAATVDRPGESLGGVYLFLKKRSYDRYAVADGQAALIRISRDFFEDPLSAVRPYYSRLMMNLLRIVSEKAFLLNRKLQLLSSGGLRRKIAGFLLEREAACGGRPVRMKREEMADFLGVARPSLSRELMQMQREGLLLVEGKELRPGDREALQRLADGE